MDATQDPVVATYRERISAVDDEILDAVNRRVTLVAELHRHKREQGYPMRDPAREHVDLHNCRYPRCRKAKL